MTRLGALALLALAGAAGCATGGLRRSPGGEAVEVFVTTGDRAKLLSRESDVRFGNVPLGAFPVIDVDEQVAYQEIVGFGASLTDASAWLIQHKLTAPQREALLRELFGSEPGGGIGFSFVRVDMGASDFSLRHYSYDDMPAGQSDPTLASFSIDADRAETIPILKRALAINPRLTVMASPWSAPGWMKTTGSMIKGTLRSDAYAPFAEYFRKFIEAYAAEGMPIYAITVQNEPHFEPENYPGMRLDPAARARFVGQYLGPLFARSGIATRILDWDHNWDEPNPEKDVFFTEYSGGARRIASSPAADGLESVAFRNTDDGSRALIVLNTDAQGKTFALRVSGRTFSYTLPAGAVATFRWR